MHIHLPLKSRLLEIKQFFTIFSNFQRACSFIDLWKKQIVGNEGSLSHMLFFHVDVHLPL